MSTELQEYIDLMCFEFTLCVSQVLIFDIQLNLLIGSNKFARRYKHEGDEMSYRDRVLPSANFDFYIISQVILNISQTVVLL